jgi:dihydrofolate reductase/thymidylate synthase
MLSFSIVVAHSSDQRGIGFQNQIPWKISKDMKRFKEITTQTNNPFCNQNAVIMGRKTYESLPPNQQPLKERLNIVISRNPDLKYDHDVIMATSLQHALELLKGVVNIDQIFVIGGESIYREAILMPNCEKIYATVIREPEDALYDTFFPKIPKGFLLWLETIAQIENQYLFKFQEYNRKI